MTQKGERARVFQHSPVYCSTIAPQLIENIAVDGANVYFVDLGRGLVKVPIGGGLGTVLADPSRYGGSTTSPTGYGIAVDGTSVYWTAALVNDDGGVYQLTPK